MNKLKTGDQVIVLTGRDKGKRGTVSARVDADHLLVEGVNVVKSTCAQPAEGAPPAASSTRPCLSTSPTWRFSTLPLARLTASVSSSG